MNILDERLEDFILTKLDQKTHQKPNRIDQLALCMNEAGHEFGPSTPYGESEKDRFWLGREELAFCSGSTLIKSAQSHLKLGSVHKDFVQSAVIGYIQPLKSYLEGEMKSITVKEKPSSFAERKCPSLKTFIDLEGTTNFRDETSRSRCHSIKNEEKSTE